MDSFFGDPRRMLAIMASEAASNVADIKISQATF